jgi:hypothetical protein
MREQTNAFGWQGSHSSVQFDDCCWHSTMHCVEIILLDNSTKSISTYHHQRGCIQQSVGCVVGDLNFPKAKSGFRINHWKKPQIPTKCISGILHSIDNGQALKTRSHRARAQRDTCRPSPKSLACPCLRELIDSFAVSRFPNVRSNLVFGSTLRLSFSQITTCSHKTRDI